MGILTCLHICVKSQLTAINTYHVIAKYVLERNMQTSFAYIQNNLQTCMEDVYDYMCHI